jgi:hypothetical protein
MHVARVRKTIKGKTYESVLLRQSYRRGRQVKHRTLASLTALPSHLVDAIEGMLKGESWVPAGDALIIQRSWPHGHVAAILGTARRLELESLLEPEPSHQRDLVLAMIVARVLQPASKLATTRLWGSTSLAGTLGVEEATEDDLYGALDWLLERQEGIEDRLAQRHLEPRGLVLYDLTSTYMEGTHCPLARRGYSRDGRGGTLQVEFGLITNAQGQPVAIEVFQGNTADATTVQRQVEKVRERFGVEQVVWVGDRGMITQAQIDKLRKLAGASWITALRAPSIRQLVEAGSIQLSLFDTQNLAEVTDPRYPGERLVVCYNPMMAQQRAGKREELLAATERELEQVARRVQAGAVAGRGRLTGEAKIGERVGRVVNKYKMAKHFTWTIADNAFSYARNEASIAQEAALDGLYVLRTNVAQERLDAPGVVLAYKSLSQVEQAFRHLKLRDLEVRPIYHYLERRVKAHLLLCVLAYYVQRAMEQALAPLLFADEAPPERPDPVAPAPRSHQAKRKEGSKKTMDGFPVHSFRTLLAELGTIVKNRVILTGPPEAPAFDQVTLPTQLQARAFQCLQLPINPL